MKKITLFLLFLPLLVFSQEDLLDELEGDVIQDKTVTSVFKTLKIVNFESTKLASKKDLYLIVAHRFGTVKNGIDDFFGLDESLTQIKFIYGFTDWLNIGVARSSNLKKYGVHAKYRIKPQMENGFPVTIVGYNLITVNTSLKDDEYPKIDFEDKLTYTSQILISRKFTENLSLLVAPSYVHENLATRSKVVQEDDATIAYNEENDQFAIGLGGRYKISKRVSINMDYGIHLNRNSNSVYNNPLSIGADIETGGHVFQLHFTNAQAMFEEGFLVKGDGDWTDGDFFFGFNLVRVF